MPLCRIEHDDLRLDIDPHLGASITRLDLRSPSGAWTPLLRPPAQQPTTRFDQTACFLMLPWVGRIRAGRFKFDNAPRQLRIDSHDNLHALHGDVHSRSWTITDRSPVSARFSLDAATLPDRNWPWTYAASVRYELAESAVRISLSITNTSESAFPFGVGFHPYFQRRLWAEQPSDSCSVQMPARGRYPLIDLAASGPAREDELSRQLKAGTTLPSPTDDAFLLREGEISISWPRSSVRVTIDRDPAFGHAQCWAPHHDGSPASFLCVEPLTTATNAFNLVAAGQTDTGVKLLAPGATESLGIALRIDRSPP